MRLRIGRARPAARTATPPPPAPETPLRATLRHLSAPPVLAGQAAAVAVLTIATPFDTGVAPTASRALYWALVVGLTYATGALVTALCSAAVEARFPGRLRPQLVLGVLIGVPAWVVVTGLTTLYFYPDFPEGPGELAGILATSIAVGFLVSLLRRATLGRMDLRPEPPPILARAGAPAEAALLALSSEDHYVRILHSAGEARLLMNLRDAIAGTGAVPGTQVHRSHWVAHAAVLSWAPQGPGAVLTLWSGVTIPVSRGRMEAARAAGLLDPARGRA